MLGAWRSEALERQVQQLAASRGAAVQAEDASLPSSDLEVIQLPLETPNLPQIASYGG